jgi:dCMP deaminase
MNSYNPLIEMLVNFKPNGHDRLSWDDFFICQALLTSFRSPSLKLQVGAVITLNNRVISTGYNGYFPGVPHESIHIDGHEVNTVHAEQNAIADAAKRGVSIDGATIYVTHFPCINCVKMIIASGIKAVKYLSDYRNDPVNQNLLDQAGVPIHKLAHCLSHQSNPTSYLCSIPIVTVKGTTASYFIILSERQLNLLKQDFKANPTQYEKSSGCCKVNPCYACLVGGLRYQIDKIKKINEITIETVCLTAEIINNQPFGREVEFRLEELDEPDELLDSIEHEISDIWGSPFTSQMVKSIGGDLTSSKVN